MNTWFLYTIGSIFTLTFAEIAQKISMTKKQDISAEANNFIVWLIQGTFALVFTILIGDLDKISFTTSMIPQFILVGSVYFLGGTIYYSSYKGGSVGINATLVTISTVLSTFLGIIALNESTDIMKFIGMGLILLAIA